MISKQVVGQSSRLEAVKNGLVNGILARNINLQYIASISSKNDLKKYRNHEPLVAKDTLTANFLRFSDFVYDTKNEVYIGKVFLSNRYLYNDFKKKYKTNQSFKNDKNGYFMMCKLYRVDNVFKVNIYPDLLTNIYDKSKLGNAQERETLGIDVATITDKDKHFEALQKIVAIPDMTVSDFIAKPSTMNNSINQSLLTINFKKLIKFFRVLEDKDKQLIGLELEYNKYSYSDDLIENHYKYDYRNYNDSLMNTQSVAETAFINSWIFKDIVPNKAISTTIVYENSNKRAQYVPFSSQNEVFQKQTITVKNPNLVSGWFLAGRLSTDNIEDPTKKIEEKIIEVSAGDTIKTSVKIDLLNFVPEKIDNKQTNPTVLVNDIPVATRLKVVELREVPIKNKKQIWLKVTGEL